MENNIWPLPEGIFKNNGLGSIASSLIYRFSAIPMKIPAAFFAEIDKLILKFL